MYNCGISNVTKNNYVQIPMATPSEINGYNRKKPSDNFCSKKRLKAEQEITSKISLNFLTVRFISCWSGCIPTCMSRLSSADMREASHHPTYPIIVSSVVTISLCNISLCVWSSVYKTEQVNLLSETSSETLNMSLLGSDGFIRYAG